MGDREQKTVTVLQDDVKANRTVKDSVFRDLFSERKYLFQLYQALHPEDKVSVVDDLKYVTLEQVLVRDIYNDLGFLVGDKLMVLVEAQSTWTVNIIVRCLMYVARTYQDYFKQSTQSLFSETPVHMPEPELYVIYTGDSKINKEYISMSEEFFQGKQTALDVHVKVITDGKDGDIINQYVIFTKVINDQVRIYGRTRQAVVEAIRICKDRNVLKEYLESKEKEVIDIMITLFDQNEVLEDYIASVKREQTEQNAQTTAKNLYIKKHMSVEDIADVLGYSVQTIEKWLGLIPQV